MSTFLFFKYMHRRAKLTQHWPSITHHSSIASDSCFFDCGNGKARFGPFVVLELFIARSVPILLVTSGIIFC